MRPASNATSSGLEGAEIMKGSRQPTMPSKDLRLITTDWPYEPGQINVRKIRGVDNRIKIQMRLDLGLLQMEMTGRPDGGAQLEVRLPLR
jgi:hypothetical protein